MFEIVKIHGAPDWERIPVLPICHALWTAPTGIQAEAQLCCDEEKLFVHLRTNEKEIRAENTEPLSPVHEDSCLEFFFKLPVDERYFNFEVNPNGCLVVQFGTCRADRVDLIRRDGKTYFELRCCRTPEGWEAFYTIPLAFLRLFCPAFAFQGMLQANFYKCGDKTPKAHYLAWSPVESEQPDFHQPAFFGTLRFR